MYAGCTYGTNMLARVKCATRQRNTTQQRNTTTLIQSCVATQKKQPPQSLAYAPERPDTPPRTCCPAHTPQQDCTAGTTPPASGLCPCFHPTTTLGTASTQSPLAFPSYRRHTPIHRSDIAHTSLLHEHQPIHHAHITRHRMTHTQTPTPPCTPTGPTAYVHTRSHSARQQAPHPLTVVTQVAWPALRPKTHDRTH